MFKLLYNFIVKVFDYIIAILISSVSVFCFYIYAPYPFESVNIIFYFVYKNFLFPYEFFFSLIQYYIFCFLLGLVYLLFIYKCLRIKRLWIGVLACLSSYIFYILIIFFVFSLNRLEFMTIYLIQDFFAFLIFYVVLSIFYKKKRIDLK